MSKRFYGYAITLGRIGTIGILAAILFRIARFKFDGWIGAMFGLLHTICLWTFYVCIPAMLILGAIAAVCYFREGKK